MRTIKHQDGGVEVVAAKLLTGALSVTAKVADPAAFLSANGTFDAGFVAHALAWQSAHGLTPDGEIGPETWAKIAATAPTCSTSKNRTSGPTLALQLLLGGNLTADAIFGPRTKAATAAWQAAHGLKADGICGPKTWGAMLAEAPCETCRVWLQPVDYKQGDSRWGKKMYSNHGDVNQTMANSGCGPTAMADIVATVRDPALTPWDMAQLAMAFGDRTDNNGTAWTYFIPNIMEHYSFARAIKTASLDNLKACLDAGGYAVCSMGPGYWTSGGHFITAWKYDSSYIYANDPASSSRKRQKIADFMAQRKQFFCFYPDEPVPDTKPTATAEAATPSTPATPKGTEIIDISKWQGNIDFDKLKDKVAFIIVRAGVGSDPDPMFDTYAKAMTERGIPFGVYGYSYAGTEAKARDEAQKLVARASKYAPLFYVMDAEETKITAAAIRAFARELRDQGAARIGCYVAHNHYKDYGYDALRDLWDFTWIPRYGTNNGTIEGATKPDYPCDLWQYASTGKIDGISGNVDKNVLTGSKPLSWFTGGE